ncbi:MAG: MmcQ/YjbR family DNA-binding protein [Calditrichaeota bacterium]|nr:MmcQ/YjbR family DNA-binding protein [Calditrichota bacterium]
MKTLRQNLIGYLRSIPHATEDIKWETNLVFSIAAKMFAVLPIEDVHHKLISFKCSETDFQTLTQMDGIIPAPYVGRYNWVALSQDSPLTESAIKELISKSYRLIFEKLPLKIRKKLN